MDKACKECGAKFLILSQDLEFYNKISPVFSGEKFLIPSPEKCFECRMKQRMTFRNESSLYRRKCSKTGEDIISMYSENAPFPVYSQSAWYGDSWDARDYGQDFDFNRPFFEQFAELKNKVPHLSLISYKSENCDFCNIVGLCKNCYLIYGSIECEDCYYGSPYRSQKCCDSFVLRNSELCIQCVDSDKLYNCIYCQNCTNSYDLKFCVNVNNSSNCFGCVNLNHKQYCIFNKQYSKEDYEKLLREIDISKIEVIDKVLNKLNKLKLSLPQRYYIGTNNENVSGNYIFNSKNCHNVYGISECQDVKYGCQLLGITDSMDINAAEYGELNYQIIAFFSNVSRSLFSYFIWDGVDSLIYCGFCNKNVRDSFGSFGLRHAQYCILNKQYTKEEYEKMVPKIIKHMQKTGEWGKFFPSDISPFLYDESTASEYFPLEKIPNKPFKIIPQEKALYERFKLALPQKSPKQRHLDRIALRNPMKLWEKKCDNCDKEIKTTYALDCPEKVYCEDCYLKDFY